MKKIITIVLAAIMAFSLLALTACGGNNSTPAPAGSDAAAGSGAIAGSGAVQPSYVGKGCSAAGTTMYGLPKPNVLDVEPEKQLRVIMDGDIACEFDDLYACCYAMMCPKFDVVGLCAEQWGTMWSQTSMQDGYDELVKLTTAMGVSGIPICHGAVNPITKNEDGTYTYETNEASDLIVEEALKDDERPLVIVVTGTMTNVAIAYLEHPEIADKELYIIGNSLPTGGWDFNLGNDCEAANVCFDSKMNWYLDGARGEATFKCSTTEMFNHLSKTGAVGDYLWERTMFAEGELKSRIATDIELGFVGQGLNNLELKSYYPNGEILEFGDFNAVVRALSLGYTTFDEVDSGHIISMVGGLDPTYVPTRKMKMCNTPADVNCYMQDFFEKLEYYFGK